MLMVALPAVLLSENSTKPPASAISRAVPPDALLLKLMCPPAEALMVALPAVELPRKAVKPLLMFMMVALPAVALSLKVVNPLLVLVMVALPAVLVSENAATAEKPPALTRMLELPAVAELVNLTSEMRPMEIFGALAELLAMPAPARVNDVKRGEKE